MANVSGNSEYGQVSTKPSEGNFREQFPNTTSTGKKDTKPPKIAKLLSYPLARRNEAPTDYLQIEIAEYERAGLNLPAFTDTNNLKPGESRSYREGGKNKTKRFDISKVEIPEGAFALSRGGQTNNFGEKRRNKQIKHIINLPIPRNVTDSQGVQYGEGSLNP